MTLYTKSETEKLMISNNLIKLSREGRLEVLLNPSQNFEYQIILIHDFYYKNDLVSISMLKKEVKNKTHLLPVLVNAGIIESASERITMFFPNDRDTAHLNEDQLVDYVLMKYPINILVSEIRQQLEKTPDLPFSYSILMLKKIYQLPNSEVDHEVKESVVHLLQGICNFQNLPTGYLISTEEISYLRQLENAVSLPLLWSFSRSYESILETMGEKVVEASGTTFISPKRIGDNQSIGISIWERFSEQIVDLFCGKSDTYNEERKKIHAVTENSLIILIPILLSSLKLPPESFGIAVFLALMVLKIGVKTLCETAGDLSRLQGFPGHICKATGYYSNVLLGETKLLEKGAIFPNGPDKSTWIYISEK